MLLAPGSILQRIHFTHNISKKPPGFFIEVGPGNGALSQVLLNKMWEGIGIELDKHTAQILKRKIKQNLESGQYKVRNTDFLKFKQKKKADLILSSMVMEHFNAKLEKQFLKKAKALLKKSGTLLCYVPGSPGHWGIEDKIAGHYRRYTFQSIKNKLILQDWKPLTVEGLTYPLSNILLPISNWLVKKHEAGNLEKSIKIRTQRSGRRTVPFKTEFPKYLKPLLNSLTLYPFVWLSNIFKNNPKSLIIFFEAAP